MSSRSTSPPTNSPTLRAIADFYQVNKGNFWLAVADGRVVGTISLLDIGAPSSRIRPGRTGAIRQAEAEARFMAT
jgi:hypothetical protein